MGELKIRPGFSARQLRLAERARHPSLFSTAGFSLSQSQKKLSVRPILLGGLVFYGLPLVEKMSEFELLKGVYQRLVGIVLSCGCLGVSHLRLLEIVLESCQKLGSSSLGIAPVYCLDVEHFGLGIAARYRLGVGQQSLGVIALMCSLEVSHNSLSHVGLR